MKLKPPFIITGRLMAGVRIGNAFVSIELGKWTSDGRVRYRYCIDIPGQPELDASDLKSGVGGGTLQGGMESLLSFLGAAAESYSYNGMDGENSDLFPEHICQWASENSDKIEMLKYEIEENKTDLIEATE